MGKFNKTGRRSIPTLNTAALPDLIFTMLFFFMIVTDMRGTGVKVERTLPEGTELEKLDTKPLEMHIYVGRPVGNLRAGLGDTTCIQLNDRLVTLADLEACIIRERASLSESERAEMVVYLEIDQDTRMGIVADIKEALRRANALDINYVAHKRD